MINHEFSIGIAPLRAHPRVGTVRSFAGTIVRLVPDEEKLAVALRSPSKTILLYW
jgi:hypothetical protein